MIPLIIFPSPLETICTLVHDTAGWTLTSHPGVYPSGRPGQVFDLPDTTPDGNGCALTIPGKKGDTNYRAVLYLHLPTGAGLVVDDFPPVSAGSSLPRLLVQGKVLMQDVP